MWELHERLVLVEYYFDVSEYKLALKEINLVKKFIKRLRRKSK